jgi:leucyl-tRNA synthetase
VAGLMELKNMMLQARKTAVVNSPAWREAVETMLLLMSPFTPHVTEELWTRIGNGYSIHSQLWPVYDAEIAKEDEITLVVQINGKVRARLQASADISDDAAKQLATGSPDVAKFFNGSQPKQVIYVKGRGIVNIVL